MITWSRGLSGTSCSSPIPTSTTTGSRSWRMADLPIVPERFKLVVRDERSKKQMNVVKRLLGRDDVDAVVNACDAGREGELIFAYLYEKAGSKKPVERLWLQSMTPAAIQRRVRPAAPRRRAGHARGGRPLALGGRLDRRHERHPRGHDPPALLLRRRGLARPRADADAGDPGPPRGGDPRVQARALLGRRRHVRHRQGRAAAATRAASTPAPTRGSRPPRRRRAIVAAVRRPDRRDHQAREDRAQGARAAALRPDLAPARRQHPLRLLRAADAGRGPAPLRGAQGAHLPAHELALPDRRHGRRDQADRRARGRAQASTRRAPQYVTGLDVLPLGRVVNDAKVTDHHAIIPTRAEHHPSRR